MQAAAKVSPTSVIAHAVVGGKINLVIKFEDARFPAGDGGRQPGRHGSAEGCGWAPLPNAFSTLRPRRGRKDGAGAAAHAYSPPDQAGHFLPSQSRAKPTPSRGADGGLRKCLVPCQQARRRHQGGRQGSAGLSFLRLPILLRPPLPSLLLTLGVLSLTWGPLWKTPHALPHVLYVYVYGTF